jgi:hypothetical protein
MRDDSPYRCLYEPLLECNAHLEISLSHDINSMNGKILKI